MAAIKYKVELTEADCNITDDNKDRVLKYVAGQIGQKGRP